VNVVPPSWQLRAPCPCCGQDGPEFAACPACQHVVLICGEVGTVFPDPHDLSRRLPDAYDRAVCPSCGGASLPDHRRATSAEVQALGFTADRFR
jgi:hypothetical protein